MTKSLYSHWLIRVFQNSEKNMEAIITIFKPYIYIYFWAVLNLQKNYEDSEATSHMPYTKFPLVLTFNMSVTPLLQL